MNYGFSKTFDYSFKDAIDRVTEELKKEGFGVLTTIDVKETLKQKLDVDFKNYVILGACNPPFAHRALLAEENIGLLLPCNVIIYEKENKTVVSIFNPIIINSIIINAEIEQIANEVKLKLEKVLESI